MNEDNCPELKLRCPECQALLRIRDLAHVPESFTCADCGQLLRIDLPGETAAEGNIAEQNNLAGQNSLQEDSAAGVRVRLASPSSAQLPPAVVGAAAAASTRNRQQSARQGKNAGPQREHAPPGSAVSILRQQLQAARQRIFLPAPSARGLSWVVALALCCGLLLLYLPGQEAAPPGEAGNGTARLEQAAPGEVLLNDRQKQPAEAADLSGQHDGPAAGGPATGGPAVPGGPDDLSEVPPAAIAEAAGEPVVPGELREPPMQPAGGPGPAAEEPAVMRPVLPVPRLARRPPVVAPQPELPVVPPVNVEARLAVRLRSYRTAAPVPVRQLLFELEEMTGVPFQLREGNDPPPGWRERTVMIAADDVTMGELLAVVAERAGLTIEAGEAAINVSPRQAVKTGGKPENPTGSGNIMEP